MSQDKSPGNEAARQREDTPYYIDATGGWGSLKGVGRIMADQRRTAGAFRTLRRQKPGGDMRTSWAWTKPRHPPPFEFCQNGAKATSGDLTRDRCGPHFFAKYSVTELRELSDHELEKTGRLIHPMRYDAATDRYVEMTWEEAFGGIGARFRVLDPKSTVFYTSGRVSLEAAYLYALFARLCGHNNLPDNSNMCHETTCVGLKEFIGVLVGTCVLDDFYHCGMIIFMAQNTSSNSPRFLPMLKSARERGCKIVKCAIEDGHERVVQGLHVVGYDLPDGCVAAFCLEVNPLVRVQYRDELSHTPAYQGVPIRIRPLEGAAKARAAE